MKGATISSSASGTISNNVLTGAAAGSIQAYVAWIDPAAANGANPTNLGLISFNDAEHGNSSGENASGHFNWIVLAPTVAGDYFIGAASTLDYAFEPWTQGGYGSLPVNAASFQVSVGKAPTNDVPEPGSLALAGLGLAGLSLVRRRKA